MFREIAEKIAEMEGGKEEVNIAQINEILKATLTILANDYAPPEVTHLLREYKNRGKSLHE